MPFETGPVSDEDALKVVAQLTTEDPANLSGYIVIGLRQDGNALFSGSSNIQPESVAFLLAQIIMTITDPENDYAQQVARTLCPAIHITMPMEAGN